jgi:NAD(P)-dependent dehydrogenase (short-subunit alcohol dehydrogenase family)
MAGLNVVVTGASQGIGRAVAIAFAEEPGARLALISRNTDAMEETAAACRDRGGEARLFPCDVTDEAAVERTARDIGEWMGDVDVLVNNAGAFTPGPLVDTTPAAFREQIDANLTSSFLVTRAFLPGMLAAGRGHLFYMGSVASIRAYPGSVAYCAAKHGVLGLARVVREETRDRGLRVTTVLPGATFTPSWAGTELPEERFMPAEDVAAAVLGVWRLSDRSVVEELLIRPQEGDV